MKQVVGIVLLAAVAGCSSSGSAGGGSGGAGGTSATSSGSCTSAAASKGCFGSCDACTVLTQAQVTAAVGVSVDAGDNAGDDHSCDWAHNDSSGIPDTQVSVDVNINTETFEKICHPTGALADAGISVTAAPGVGDDACFVQIQGLGSPDLTFLEGCWAYTISILATTSPPPADATIEADEKTLALDALPNL